MNRDRNNDANTRKAKERIKKDAEEMKAAKEKD
jgi:hypothetical protein